MSGNFDFPFRDANFGFLTGKDAELLYEELRKTIKKGVWYDEDSRTIKGSSTFLAAGVDNLVRPLGFRVAKLADFGMSELLGLVKGDCDSDVPSMVLRSLEDEFEPNRDIIEKLVPQVEQKIGRLQLPVLITGFDVQSSENKQGYGLDIVPREDFSVLHDERLSGENTGKRFSRVDKFGLPNFEESGNRTWYARKKGLSGLCLYRDLSLVSRYTGDLLADSDSLGKIVIVRNISESA